MKNAQQRKKAGSDWGALAKAVRQRTIISHAELVPLVRRYTAVTLAYALQRLKQDKVLNEVGEGRRGVYLVTEKNQAAFAEDPIETIQTMYGSGAQLAYGTALFLHGLSRYGRLSEYYVVSQSKQRPKMIGDFVVKALKSPVSGDIGMTSQKYGNRSVCLTDLERTLIDCIHRPKYAQGWENVAHALRRAKHVNGGRMIEYVKLYRNPLLVARIGLVVEHYCQQWRVADERLDTLREYLPQTRVKFERGCRGVLHKRWNLIVPVGIFEEQS